jgi:hypothetical protein
MDRTTETFTNRGWDWACGTGHTIFNRIAYDATTGKYAALCSTDYNQEQIGGLGGFFFRMEDGEKQEFHRLNLDGLRNKGGASALVPRSGGGFLGVIVGVPGDPTPGEYPDDPPTQIGLVKWNGQGVQEGAINWAFSEPDRYLSYSTLLPLAPERYLLGYGAMRAVDHEGEVGGENSYRVPWDYFLVEIDEDGNQLTDVVELDGTGWGEVDEGDYVSCNQDSLELSVYTSPDP